MATISFVQRLLRFTIQLAANPPTSQPGTFAGTNNNQAIISNVRASCQINHSGSLRSTADVRIFGLSQSLMNELTTLGFLFNQVPINTLIIEAGDTEDAFTQIFQGTINRAYGDYQNAPDVAMHFETVAAGNSAWVTNAATSFPGATDVYTVVQQFASQMRLTPENNLPGAVSGPYQGHYSGSVLDQVRQFADDANVTIEITDGGNTLAVWPKGGSRNTSNPPLLSPTTGMVGYPSFTQGGVVIRSIFNPNIVLGSKFTVQSSIPQANKTWTVNAMDLYLESLTPDGQWIMTIAGWAPSQQTPTPPPISNL